MTQPQYVDPWTPNTNSLQFVGTVTDEIEAHLNTDGYQTARVSFCSIQMVQDGTVYFVTVEKALV